MNNDTKGIVIPLNKEQLKELTKETMETLATNMLEKVTNQRTFGSVDLWNSRKNQRTMVSMRKWFN
jgi:hypothetical protein